MLKPLLNRIPQRFQQFLIVEGIGLILAAPFLIFPFQFLPATLLALLIIAWLWIRHWRGPEPLLPSTPFNGAFLLLSAAILMGMIVSETPEVTIPKATGLILGLSLWRFIVVAICRHRQLISMVTLYMLIGLGMMAGGLFVVQWYVKIPFFQNFSSLFPPYLLHLPSSPILGVSPNQLAGTLLFFLPLTIVTALRLWPERQHKLLFILGVGGGLLLAFLLTFSQSRSGWIGAVASIGSMVGLYIISLPFFKSRYFSHTRTLLYLLVVVVLVGGWAALSPGVSETMDSTIEELPRSSSYNIIFRQEVWRVGVEAVGEYSLTGVGLGSFRRVFTTDYVTTISPEIDIAHAHNIFLQVALDIGLPGLAAYLAILIIAFSVGWQLIREAGEMKPLAISLLASLIGFHFYSLTDAISFGSKTHFVYWLVIGLLAGMGQMSKLGRGDGSQ